jgi:putative flippase GtrA
LRPPLPVRFALVGLAGAAMYYALLWSMVELGGVPALGASSLAFVLVVAENYVLHRCWTFSSDAPHRQAFPRFALMAGCGAAVNAAVMAAGLRLGWHYLLAQTLALVAVVSCNVAGTWMIFRGGPEDAAP